MAGARSADAAIVGKANMHELLTASEAAALHAHLMTAPDGISDSVRAMLRFGAGVTDDQRGAALACQLGWKALLAQILGHVDLIALPTVPFFPPPLLRPAPYILGPG